jgi:hypothetical protein
LWLWSPSSARAANGGSREDEIGSADVYANHPVIVIGSSARRGGFAGVPNLVAAIGRYIAAWNADCHPFVWVAETDQR